MLEREGASVRGAVLDLGCGRSPFRQLFAGASRYIRIDCYPVDADVIVADASALPLEPGSVDCILLSQVLGDVADLAKLFRELDRVLAPGGRIMIYETMSYPQHDLPHDCWRILPGGLEWLGAQTGLKVREVVYLGGYFTQLAMHANAFLVGALDRFRVTRPLAWAGRAATNVVCAALDSVLPQPTLATDYFAVLTKPERGR